MVVGVVGDVRVRGLERESEPQVYVPYKQMADNAMVFYAPKDLAIKCVGPARPAGSASAGDHPRGGSAAARRQHSHDVRVVAADTASRTVQLRVLGVFAAIAILLAGIGIHGLLSFTVSQRTLEIGVRMALGAQRRDILGMILKRSVVLTVLGVIPGVALAYAAGRSLQTLLAGVAPADPLTFGTAILVTIAMATAGTLLPTLRAVRVDAIRAMRGE